MYIYLFPRWDKDGEYQCREWSVQGTCEYENGGNSPADGGKAKRRRLVSNTFYEILSLINTNY